MTGRSRSRNGFAGCAIFCALLALIAVGWLTGGPYTAALPRAFASDRWKAAGTLSDTRCAMLVDLRARIGIEGRTRKELLELLGPDENETGGSNQSHWHLCPSFMDIWILEVRWKRGIAEEAWVRDT